MAKSNLFNQIERDEFLDDIGSITRHLLKRKNWNKRSELLKENLIKKLKEKGYYYFIGDPYRYFLGTIGSSVILTVPEQQRGHLKKFRGKRIRLVCVESGRYKRGYMAGLI